MFKHALVVLSCVSLLFVGNAQERAKKKGPADFVATIEKVKVSWQAENYGACMKDLQVCMNLLVKKRTAAIRAALPAAPEGWMFKPEKVEDDPSSNPMLAAMTASVGSVIERKYEQEEGNGNISVSVMADSPMVQMLSMMFTNPAIAGSNAEQIGYGAHKGLLTKENRGLSLQILIADAHVIEVKLRTPKGMEAEAAEALLFSLFDQAAVDQLAAALAK